MISYINERNLKLIYLEEDILKNYQKIIKSISYINNDVILTELIIELRKRINLENKNIFYYKNIINLACYKISDATNLIKYFLDNPDFYFLLELFEIEIDKKSKDIYNLSNYFFDNEDFKKIINEKLLFSEPFNQVDIERLVKLAIINKNYDLVDQIFYSRHVHKLTKDTLLKVVQLLEATEEKNYLDRLENISSLQDNQDKVTNLPERVIDIYRNIYTINSLDDPKKYLMYNTESFLTDYSDETLEMFINSLNQNNINRTSVSNSTHDLMSIMIKLQKKYLAQIIFNKEIYQPIDKKLRKNELKSSEWKITEFSPRLNTNIRLALLFDFHDLVLSIISSEKVDSINIFILYKIIVSIENYQLDKNEEKTKTFKLIIDTLLLRISDGTLKIYRTEQNLIFGNEKYSFVLATDDALDLANEMINNKQDTIYNILDSKSEIWKK